MSRILNILILAGLVYVGFKCQHQWRQFKAQQEGEAEGAEASGALPGLPPNLEASLIDARKNGSDGLHDWLQKFRRHVKDPQLAAIELDYVVLVGARDPDEAKAVLARVKRRVKPDSPVYERVNRLSRTYE